VALLILPLFDVQAASIAAGATTTLFRLAPRDGRQLLRLRHLHLHANVNARVYCDIPGLSDLNGMELVPAGLVANLTLAAAIMPIFSDVPGDARGSISLENLTGGAAVMHAGLDGYYLSSEDDERAILPDVRSPSFARGSATIGVNNTGFFEMLRFQAPAYRGGVVLTGLAAMQVGGLQQCSIAFEGIPGLTAISLAGGGAAAGRVYPLTAWIPPLGQVRVLMRRDVGGTVNSCVALYGHGLP
jgi:hypothetical protein